MTTRFTVLDETHRHPELSEQLTAILHTVAPIVRETTGLALSAQVRFRLMTPKRWRTCIRQSSECTLARDITDLEMTDREISRLRTGLKTVAPAVLGLTRPLIAAVTMEAADGRLDTVLAPRTLHHGGLLADERCLTMTAAHELVHHAQLTARGPIVWETFFHERRGLSHLGRSGTTVLEGHAAWADRQVTTRLYGAPVDNRQLARRSWRYRLHAAVPGINKITPQRAQYEQWARFIAEAVGLYGTDVVNRVWTDAALLPTAEEIPDPGTWARRLAAASPDDPRLTAEPVQQS